MVVKEVHGSGGYGMLVGPLASKTEISKFKNKIIKNPYNYIAQPTLSLSTCPIYTKKGLTSILGCFLIMRSASTSPDPIAKVQPECPWPVLTNKPDIFVGPM